MSSRQIKSYVPTRAEGTKRELYMSYMKGWRDGAGIRAQDKAFIEHATRPDLKAGYLEGYLDGHRAMKAASAGAIRVFGYTPTILRATEAEGES